MEQVYPIKALANGGLLGDVIYFSVSGFLLYSSQIRPFPSWYFRRLRRVYLPTWITIGFFMLLGAYGKVPTNSIIRSFLWPIDYHFVTSIIVLYVFYYCLIRVLNFSKRKNAVLFVSVFILLVCYFILYYTVFDYSFYHIDNVYSPFIWFLYLFAMIIGLFFRLNSELYIGRKRLCSWFGILLFGLLYCYTKAGCIKGWISPSVQWVNQFSVLLVLSCVFRSFIGLEEAIYKIPDRVSRIIRFFASLAFEIYLVQIVLISKINIGKQFFPLNMLIVLLGIIVCAYLVHLLAEFFLQFGEKKRANY